MTKNGDQTGGDSGGSDNAPFFLRTLGEVALSDADGRPVRLRTRKALLVLTCLATEPDRPWTRETLAAFFWGDRQDEQARNSLRTALSDIRRGLGQDAVAVDGHLVRLTPGIIATDTARLDAQLQTTTASNTDTIDDTGEFAAGVDESEAFAGWAAELRARYRDRVATLLDRDIAQLDGAGETAAAIARARQLLALDPLSEQSHRTLMRLYADNGERSKAIAQYQACRQMLRHELDVDPSEETTRLADEIAVRTPAAVSELRQIVGTGPQPPESSAATRDVDQLSVAVLPFVNMSGDAGQGYFAEGVAEDIATDLSASDHLSVVAGGSTRPYLSSPMRPDAIAAELGVCYLLEGSVRRVGADLRITAKLIDGRSNRQLWAERFDRTHDKLFEVQSEIAAAVTAAVTERLAEPTPDSDGGGPGTESREAHEHYLRGRAFLKEMTRQSVELSRGSFEHALEIDPDYALAHAGLAEAISMLGFHYDYAGDLLDSALVHCERALALNPGLAEAHCSRGRLHSLLDRIAESEGDFARAIELSPRLHTAHYYRGLMYLVDGRPHEARGSMERAFELDPQDLQIGMMLLNCHTAVGDAAAIEQTARRVLTLARKRLRLNAYDNSAAYVGAFALTALGEREEAVRWASVAAAFDIDDPRTAYNIACLYALMGDDDQALRHLRKTLELGVPPHKIRWIRDNDSDWSSLRGDPRFEALFEATDKSASS